MGFKEILKRGESIFSSSDSTEKKEDANVEVSSDVAEEYEENNHQTINVFQHPETAKYYMSLYENANYECRHLVDPDFRWTKEEERKLVRKTDWYVTFWAFIMFCGLNLDRYNLTFLTATNMLKDIGISTNDYNTGNVVNLVCFLGCELPSQLISKWLGPDRWIPAQLTLWSIVSISQCKMHSRGAFLATRALIGGLEGGFIPDVSLWMSYFYTNKELTVRFAWFYISNPFTQAITGLLSAAIFPIENRPGVKHLGMYNWQWTFLVEGLITLVIGLCSFFKMPASVAQTRKWFRREGWFTEREEKIMVNRVIRDDPSKGTMNNRQAISPKMLWHSLTDYDLWPLYFIRVLIDIISTPLSKYSSIILKQQGFSAAINNLLQVPWSCLSIITLVSASHGAQYFKKFGWFLVLSPLWLMPCIVAMRWWPDYAEKGYTWQSYIILFFALGYPPSWAISISWTSENSNSVRTRSVSAALVNMFSQAGSIIGSELFRQDDKPKYHRGLEQDFGISIGAIAAVILGVFYYILKNKWRDRKWASMSEEEQLDYTLHTKDIGNKRLDFRFSY